MNKKINFSDREDAVKRCKDNANIGMTLSSKPVSSLAIAITAITGCLMNSGFVQAGINVPTDMTASPLCINGQCASAFTAKMLLFEEFGLEHFSDDSNSNSGALTSTLPSVADCQSMPNGAELDNFLKEDIHPLPSEEANESLPNAWDAKVRECVGLTPEINTVIEGRPPGAWFAHQRYAEFPSQAYFQTAMTGARPNGGLRDKYQRHEYKNGEFAPDHDGNCGTLESGLYCMPGDTTAGIDIKMHPNLPTQNPSSVWTFDGTLPPKLLMARYGETILFRHYNALPIDVAANNGFGMHTISTHEHNGHNPAESDGFAHAYFYPGQFYDYHWPMVLAGHDSINTGATDPKTGAPDDNGGITQVPGDWRETMSTHWFHDHMLDFTAQNVYKGNAAMMNYYSAIDRGREPVDLSEATTGESANSGKVNPGYGCHYANPNSANLCLPSGSSLDWGNRDYDVNLVVADKAWDNNGQLKFNIFNTDGFLGDRVTVNWVYKPYMDVRARKYRFRILNGSVSRYFKIAIVDELGNKIPYHMIANDGNIMQHAVAFPNAASAQGALPEQSIAERYDIIVDFKDMVGKKIYFVNILEHENGKGPARVISLASVLNGTYKPDGKLGDPGVGKFLELRVKPYNGVDYSMNPADYIEGKKQMIPLNKPTANELKAAIQRTFEFGRSNGTDTQPWTIKTDGGIGLPADPHRVSAAPELGKVEIWHLKGGNGWAHPVHVHFEEGQLLYRGGKTPPPWEKYARKDVYRVGPLAESTLSVDIAIRIREFAGTYVEHCHNTQHEDKAMLLRWDSQHPGQIAGIPTPELGWEGAFYSPSVTLPTYKIGDLAAKKNFILPK
ncbi:MAG: multicopper oxidase domain-containing protein [Methyloglobulus sp.]